MEDHLKLRYYPREDGNIVISNTGEIISYEEYLNIRSIEKETQKAIDQKVKEINTNIDNVKKGEDSGFYNNWLTNYHFTKVVSNYHKEWSDKMDIYERAIMHLMTDLIEWETNRVLVNGKDITNKYMREKLQIGNSNLTKTLNVLEDKNIIRRVGNNKARRIYVNPLYVYKGKKMSNNTLKMFKIDKKTL